MWHRIRTGGRQTVDNTDELSCSVEFEESHNWLSKSKSSEEVFCSVQLVSIHVL